MQNSLITTLPLSIPFKLTFNLKILWSLIGLLVFSLILITIVQLNSQAREFYLIKNSQALLAQLTQENKSLEVSFSKENSLANINNYLTYFEKVNKVEYIRVLQSSVAAK